MESLFKNSDIKTIRFLASFLLLMLPGFLFFESQAQNQVRITTNVLPPYSPYIQDYPGTGNRVQVFISNLSGKALSVRLLGKLEGDNGVVIKTSANYRPLRPLELRSTDVNRMLTRTELEGLFDLAQIDVQGMNKNELYRGLPLPEGNYQLCIQAFDNATIRPLSAEFPMGCSGLIPVRIIEPPILISPFDNEEVMARTPQTQMFTWSAPVGILPNQVEYTLRIIELPGTDVNPNVFIDAVVLPRTGLEIKNLRTTTFLYGPSHPALQFGKRYAWRVQAHPLSQKLNFMNEGKSPVQVFTYGLMIKGGLQPGIEVANVPLFPLMPLIKDQSESKMLSSDFSKPCECNPVQVTDDQKVDNKKALKDKKATIANFNLEFLAGVTETNGKLNGMGMIPVPMINSGYVKLRVQLIDVQCNAQGKVIAGIVKGKHKDGFPGLMPNIDQPNAPEMKIGPEDIEKMGQRFSASKDELVSNLKNSANGIGFELPWGIDKGVGSLQTVVAITDITFSPKRAAFSANTWIETPNSKISGLALSGYNMCLSPSKPCGEGILYLAKDASLTDYFSLYGDNDGLSGSTVFVPDTNKITYVQFDQDGFKKMRIHGLMSPPGLVKAESNEPLKISINADINNGFKDWTVRLAFDKFYVKGLPDFKFSMNPDKPAFYDHSELSTPGALPEGYETEDGQAGWQGLYFPEIAMELPAFVKDESNKPVTAKVRNLIFDGNGFSGRALVEDILTIDKGSLGGWYYSIDVFDATFKNSGFVASSMKGKIVLPVFDYKNPSSHLVYGSTISKNESSGQLEFALNIEPAKPAQPIDVPVWNNSKLTLSDGSAITVTYNAQGFEAKAALNGSLDIMAGPLTIPAAKFTNLVLSTKGPDYFSLESFTMSTASPQKELSDRPFNLDFTGKPKNGKPGFQFHCDLDLSEGVGITATGDLVLGFTTGNNSQGRPDWKYTGMDSELSAEGGIGDIRIEGALSLYSNNPVYGNAFYGKLRMQMLEKFDVHLDALFGKTTDDGGFNYWYIGGKAEIPGLGVPLAGPVMFKGFGGGLYSNVAQTFSAERVPTYTPKRDGFGFNASVLVGLATPNLLDAEGTFSMSFEGSVISDINIHADAWFLGTSVKSALATGSFDLDINPASQIVTADVDLNAGLDLGAGSIHAHLPAHLEVNYSAKPNWYLAIGAPTQDGRVALAVKFGLQFNFGAYFVMGSYTPNGWVLPPSPYGFDGDLLSLFNRVSGSRKDNISSGFKNGSKSILAFGAGYAMKYDYNIGPFYMNLNGAIGYDMVLKEVDAPCSAGGSLPGIYGWYAEGQLCAGMSFALGIDVDIWVYEGRIEVAKLSAGALLRGGLVNPIWFNGQVAVRYSVLRGLVKGNFNFDFWYNRDQRCDPAYLPPNPFADLPLISSIGPSGTDTKTSIISPLTATFNYPVENKLIVEIEIPEGKTVDQSAIGTVNGQTFVQEFKLLFKEKFVTAAQTGVQVKQPSNDSGSLVMGKNSEGERNYSATFYRDNALRPNTTYDLTVGLKVFVYNPKKGNELEPFLFKNQTVEQTEKVSFITGECPTDLSKGASPQNVVLTSYPYEGQRYYMKGEPAKPFIKLKSKLDGCLNGMGSDDNYDLMVAMTPLEGSGFAKESSKSILLADAEFVGDKFTYSMPPGIKNNTLYRLQLLRAPKDDYVNAMLAEGYKGQMNTKKITSANIYKSNATGTTAKLSGNVYGNNISASAGKTYTPNGGITEKINGSSSEVNTKNIDSKWMNMVNTYSDENQLNSIAKDAQLTASIDPGSVKTSNTSFTLRQLEEMNAKIPDLLAKKEKLRKTLRMELYRYYFKSSKYNTMKEKIGTASFTTANAGSSAPGIKTGDYVTGSMTTDEGFDRYDLNFEDLGSGQFRPPLLLLRATENSAWYKQVAKPIADLLSESPDEYFKSGKYQGNSELLEGTLDGFRRSMVQFSTYFTPTDEPFENTEIYRLFPSEVQQ